jgi:predicted GNAT superfamily acetyltransferase
MDDIVIRECLEISELDSCVRLQREVFGLPELEISPRRHLIVSRQAGGWTLGAFDHQGEDERLIGFVHHLAAVRGDEIFGYSHMMAVARDYQNKGVGARLKWSQRERAIAEGRKFIKWTWDPMQARNAHFNLNRLGVTVHSYAANFYGTDYATTPTPDSVSTTKTAPGIDSDRLFANWQLESRRVSDLASGTAAAVKAKPAATIVVPNDWNSLLRNDPVRAKQELWRVREEFQSAFAAGLICAAFERPAEQPRYLLYEEEILDLSA